MVFISFSFIHLVVIAGVPILSHEGLNGGFGSSGIVLLLVLIPILSSAFSVIDPLSSVSEKSNTTIWLSVPQVTSLYHLLRNSCAIVCEFFSVCSPYCLNSGVDASCKATAIPAIVFMCGHHCTPGKTALSIRVGIFSIVGSGFLSGLDTFPLDKINDPLGHLNDLCVVVIIT